MEQCSSTALILHIPSIKKTIKRSFSIKKIQKKLILFNDTNVCAIKSYLYICNYFNIRNIMNVTILGMSLQTNTLDSKTMLDFVLQKGMKRREGAVMAGSGSAIFKTLSW
ncbi:MAG TPA: hypothetical protein DC024_07400 [Clostridiales bacterium]|nr:hypothetical protein [Clostridiales bacterium]